MSHKATRINTVDGPKFLIANTLIEDRNQYPEQDRMFSGVMLAAAQAADLVGNEGVTSAHQREFKFELRDDSQGNQRLMIPQVDFVDLGMHERLKNDDTLTNLDSVSLFNENVDVFLNLCSKKKLDVLVNKDTVNLVTTHARGRIPFDADNLLMSLYKNRKIVHRKSGVEYLISDTVSYGYTPHVYVIPYKEEYPEGEKEEATMVVAKTIMAYFKKEESDTKSGNIDLLRYRLTGVHEKMPEDNINVLAIPAIEKEFEKRNSLSPSNM